VRAELCSSEELRRAAQQSLASPCARSRHPHLSHGLVARVCDGTIEATLDVGRGERCEPGEELERRTDAQEVAVLLAPVRLRRRLSPPSDRDASSVVEVLAGDESEVDGLT